MAVSYTHLDVYKRQGQGGNGDGGGPGTGGPGGNAGSGKGGRKKKRTWLDRVLLAGIVIVALALVGIGSGWAYVNYRFNQVQKVTVKHLRAAPVGSPFNVLLIGSDSRVGESAAEATHFGSESETGGQRSDCLLYTSRCV